MSLPAESDSHNPQPQELAAYSRLNFGVVGQPDDGGAGHFIALAAFQRFVSAKRDPATDRHRPFSVSFFGLGADFLSRQLMSIGTALLQDRINFQPVPAAEAFTGVAHLNVAVCCSLGRAPDTSAYPLLANGCLFLATADNVNIALMRDGVNGYRVRPDDVSDLARAIERVLNREATPDRALRYMGEVSKTLAGQFRANWADQAGGRLR